MNARLILHIFVGFLIAAALAFFATQLYTGSGSSMAEMLAAQRKTPLLWVVDVCAVGFLLGIGWYGVMLNQFQKFTDHQARQHHEQLDDMIERTCELERVNDTNADRIERLESELKRQTRDLIDQISTLEAATEARREVFEIETRRITDHSSHSFQTHLDANTRQVEAMNMALQFQRGELRRLRHEIRDLQNLMGTKYVSTLRSPDYDSTPGSPSAGSYAVAEDEVYDSHLDAEGRSSAEAISDELTDEIRDEHVSSNAKAGTEDVERHLAIIAHQDVKTQDLPAEDAVPQPSWFSEYSDHTECMPDWNGQGERLFYEAHAVGSHPESNGVAHLSESADSSHAQRMVDSERAEIESDVNSQHIAEGGSELTPASEATA